VNEKFDALPISLVAHTVFCPRRAWLEAAGETVPSLAIEHGLAAHANIDARVDERRASRRSVEVEHESLGLTGRCDVVESVGGNLSIVEYKSSPVRRRPLVTEAQRVQLALQGLCLESMGQRVTAYSVYFTNHRKQVPVEVDETLRASASGFVLRTREIVESPSAPLPLVDDPKCSQCSHAGVCLPNERSEERVRRYIRVADPDGQTLHLMTPGARASLDGGRVLVGKGDERIASSPIELVQALVVHGNVDVSSGLIRELLWRGVPITWCSGRGSVVGYARSTRSPNGAARVAQRAPTPTLAHGLSREFIAAKISNQATQLRRSSRADVTEQVRTLRSLTRAARAALTSRELFGVEGEAASIYFAGFPGMIAEGASVSFVDGWPGRMGRGASDSLNVGLNFVYGLLVGECIRALTAAGLDPHAGVLHSSGRNKPGMALDLMEEFRVPLGDAVLVGAINNGELTEAMFTSVLGGARLRDSGRRTLVEAFERRLAIAITHPVFGYPATWRRTIEIQARMILGMFDGSQARYVGVRLK